MDKRSRLVGYSLLAVFILSGFSGLIYQAIWSHYLGLILGHAAYAQTLVLAIFMGGMAAGAAAASRYSPSIRNLILAYALIELIIGLAALVFHPGFLWYTQVSQQTVLPALATASSASFYQWVTAAALILPQCILLGATFPILSAGYLRLAPAEDAKVLGGLYFANSLGAAAGALAATFLLLPALGMPGSMALAGWLNLAVAAAAGGIWLVTRAKERRPAAGGLPATPALHDTHDEKLVRLVIASTFLSGTFSFVYELGWIRLLNQVLGTTLHSFELMLSAFIAGLAFGGLWIRNKADRIHDAILYAGYAQVLMGIAALFSVVVFNQSFGWVGWMLESFQRNDAGYNLFVLGSATISLLVMFPAAFFAGMTLPLFTVALLRGVRDERSIGRVYAANTLGSIAGVLLAVHILIPVVGVHLSIMLAALGDILIGAALFRHAGKRHWQWTPARGAFALLIGATIGVSFLYGKPDPFKQVAGVFRTGHESIQKDSVIVFLKDGKTATVGVYGESRGDYGVISTNGKPDASLSIHDDVPPLDDEITMAMVASLPLAIHPDPKHIAVIGWGSGLTTHTFLGSDAIESVQSIEIEREMWNGAKLFGDRVGRAYSDPRSKVVFEDARTWFSTGARKYDIIVSEPSNPWISGVASLFTLEFYQFLRTHLREDGLLVQWMQTYELSDRLLAQMTAALTAVFPHVQVYTTNGGDLLFVASMEELGEFQASQIASQPIAGELTRVGLATSADYEARYIGDRNMLTAFATLMSAPVHSDFYPTVSLQAPRDRFAQRSSTLIESVYMSPLPLMQILGDSRPISIGSPVINHPLAPAARGHAATVVHALRGARHDATDVRSLRANLEAAIRRDGIEIADSAWTEAVAELAAISISHFPAADLQGSWISPNWVPVHLRSQLVTDVISAYESIALRDARLGSQRAKHVLEVHGASISPKMREQLLVAGLVNEAIQGDLQAAQDWEASFGQEASTDMLQVRAFLLAWADKHGEN